GKGERGGGWSECGKKEIRGENARLRHAIEQRRFASIGIADQCDNRIRHAPSAGSMERASALHRRELAFDLGKPLVDHAAVGLELRFARPAEEAKTPALALKVGPGTNQPAFL